MKTMNRKLLYGLALPLFALVLVNAGLITYETKEDNSIQNETIIKEKVSEDNEIIKEIENKTNRDICLIILLGIIVCIIIIYYLIKKMKGGNEDNE